MMPAEILALPMQANDAGATTVRGYLIRLLAELWNEGEGFSGKRPFGNSGWEYDLYLPLIKAGVVDGSLDDNGYVDDIPPTAVRKADHLIAVAIASLARA